MKAFRGLLALACAPLLALFLAGPAMAQGLPTVKGNSGSALSTTPVAVLSYDLTTGLPCVAGQTTNCAVVVVQIGYDSVSNQTCIIGSTATCMLQTNAISSGAAAVLPASRPGPPTAA
jgi:hypothetical protein